MKSQTAAAASSPANSGNPTKPAPAAKSAIATSRKQAKLRQQLPATDRH
jgi:hypothetical protein